MKNFLLLTWILTSSIVQAAQNNDFQCVNNMYREARFDLIADRLLVQDTTVREISGLREALKSLIGLKGDLVVNLVSLEIIEASKACSSSTLKLLVNCAGPAGDANLHIEAMVYTKQKPNVRLSLDLPVDVKELTLNSQLQSDGPVSLDGSSTTVELQRLQLNAHAEILIGQKELSLEWDTFFYTQDKKQNSASFCKK